MSFQSSKLPELHDGGFLLNLMRRSLSDVSSLPWLLVSTEMSDNVSLISSLNTQETLAVNLFLLLSKVWHSMGLFSRKHALSQLSVNNSHSKLYEYLRNSLVTALRSQTDDWTEKQSPHKAFFFFISWKLPKDVGQTKSTFYRKACYIQVVTCIAEKGSNCRLWFLYYYLN